MASQPQFVDIPRYLYTYLDHHHRLYKYTMKAFANALELGRWDSEVEQTVFLTNITTRVIHKKGTLGAFLFIESIIEFGEILVAIILTRLVIANR